MLTCVGGLARRRRPGFLSRVMPAIRELPSRRQDGVLEAAVLTVWTFLLYAAGACPTIYVGDSGELVTAVQTVGIPHPFWLTRSTCAHWETLYTRGAVGIGRLPHELVQCGLRCGCGRARLRGGAARGASSRGERVRCESPGR